MRLLTSTLGTNASGEQRCKSEQLWPERRNQSLLLFCFPHAGGNACAYRKWQEQFAKDIIVCPVELPGHGRRWNERLITRLLQLSEAVKDAVLSYVDRPFVLFGHSMGALLAFEVARRLQQGHNLAPERLLVAGRRAPQLSTESKKAHNLPRAEFIEELKEFNSMPEEILGNHEALDLVLPVLRADFEAVDTYSYAEHPLLTCPIRVYGGLNEGTDKADLECWQEVTTATCSVRMVPGDHFFVSTKHFQALLKYELYALLENMTYGSRSR